MLAKLSLLAAGLLLIPVASSAQSSRDDEQAVEDLICSLSDGCVVEPPPPDPKVRRSKTRRFVIQQRKGGQGRADLRVSFVTDSAELTPQGRSAALIFVKAIKSPRLASKRFRIEGHTDAVGSREHNLALSRQRAEAVVAFVVAQGARPARFAVQGYGYDKPLPGRSAVDGANRRVEVVRIN